ncbi:alpha/beta hydrolase [Modestobacter sp. VKM Ac-2986]|uniref:alpha/beta fold hydrolase n=1 Tax=Modestobacter sp. VKM Ac-2986 TaxID=3004140 RepID=UPI0022AB9B5E|nr:alpha/beta hydrolase [Modestobacter sp. VKM Ac-2986]MCZ2829274.1 alpha/beta hydrolase [Modestobacter sp. VKM Ac-2986]
MTHPGPVTVRPADWPPGATSSVTDLDGPVHWLDLGGPAGAPVLVAVHGLGGSALNWGLLGPRLAATHRVLAVDLVGHGGSGLPDPGRGLAADRRVLHRFLTEVAGAPVVLLGHSMGGVLALQHTAEHPGTVDRLVLLSPPVPGGRGRLDRALLARRALLRLPGVAGAVRRRLAALTPEEVVDQQLRRATPHADRVPADAVAASVAETRLRAGRSDAAGAQAQQWAGIVDTMALLGHAGAWRRTLAGIDVPVLWLQGADDPLSRADRAAALAATRPDWPFLVRAGAGHLLSLEDPEWTAARITDWLAAPQPG